MDAMARQDAANRAGRDATAETGQFSLDPLITPSGILSGQANNDGLDVVAKWSPALRGRRVGPMPAHHPPGYTMHRSALGDDSPHQPLSPGRSPAVRRPPGGNP